MRIENGTLSKAKAINFAIKFPIISSLIIVPLGIIIEPLFFVMFFLVIFVFGLTMASGFSYNSDTELNFWKNGFKRKFRTWIAPNGKTYVETKVGFFWIPIKERLPNRLAIKLAEFDDPKQAIQFVHKERGMSSAICGEKFKS